MTLQQRDELRKELEKAGLYDLLCSIHESHEDDDCFCTTEISLFYRQLLALIQSQIDKAVLEARIEENDYHWHRQKAIEQEAKSGGVSGYFLKRKAQLQQSKQEDK